MEMWTYFFGPIFAIFPTPWRKALPFSKKVEWDKATVISGLIEAVLALVASMYWYYYDMSLWSGNAVGAALEGKMGPGVRPQDIGGVALIVWWMHPVTWLCGYLGLEGIIRLCTGAFGEHACGIFPLFLVDKILFSPFRRRKEGAGAVGNVSSFAGAIHERVRTAGLAEVPDELLFTRDESGEILEICASRRKQDWTPPRTVRYLNDYYRLESDSSASGPRPFRYRLRRLAAGVPGRTVIFYAPPDAVIRTAVPR
jgi:hypothetical protein